MYLLAKMIKKSFAEMGSARLDGKQSKAKSKVLSGKAEVRVSNCSMKKESWKKGKETNVEGTEQETKE